ncbi:helix-turn-helix domain-containing protein [Myxococcota bacterium]
MAYAGIMTDEQRTEVALWRLSVLGPMISARREHGDLRAFFEQAAQHLYQHPDGRWVRLSPRTLEDWHYAYQHGGLEALKPAVRKDRGRSRVINPEVAELLLAAKREKPRRSVRRLIRMLERAGKVRKKELKRSTVHRLLAAHGISSRPRRGEDAERRSFGLSHAGDLWQGDAMHGPQVIAPDGLLRKAYLLSQIDVATRFVPHSFFALSEGAVDHEHGLKQALLKHGRPRAYYVDRGAAYMAHSLRIICGELGFHLWHTPKGDAPAKGVIEKWHRTWREEVGDELPDEPLPLGELNAIHWAWLGAEYHGRIHHTTGWAPREHWLSEAEHLRSLPPGKNLDDVFLHRRRRTVRKDGTVRWGGGYLEVRAELVGRRVELRFDPAAPEELPRVFIEGRFYCDTVPQDRFANANRKRRRKVGEVAPPQQPSGLDPLQQLQDEHYRRTRPVGSADHEAQSGHDDKED